VTEAREILRQICTRKVIPVVPDLWYYEVANGIRTAVSRKRITKKEGKAFIDELASMGFENHSIINYLPKVFEYAVKYKYAVYDLSYLVLAEEHKIDFVTGDARFRNVVGDDLRFVFYLSDFFGKQ
jgi:predicted nucleic acid-binding protein